MIRIKLGTIYHFGIFVSEDEVIQFGYPPLPEYQRPIDEVVVIATDIDTFACGQIVETAVCERKEKRRRFASAKTVALAREALGRGGYDLLRNNCEHFAYECYLGEHKSEQIEDAIKKMTRT
ncbi:MAG: lecithin retinol acyltransferase family protein [Clostridia bacterium]|nr:lecithin retinol acyltransferase family protein [Clostridia bacterium]